MPRVVPSQVVELIDVAFPQARSQRDRQDSRFSVEREHQAILAGILALIDQIPPELINLETSGYLKFVASVEAIRSMFPTWQMRNYGLERIPGLGNLNPVTLIRQSLEQCPDEAPAPTTVGLEFIRDTVFRDNLRTDISAANQALINGEWKAATVLAGAVVEALLLLVLQEHEANNSAAIQDSVMALRSRNVLDRNPGSDLERWSLHPLIEVAKELTIISAETANQARLAKNFRDLIHPGRTRRRGQECNRGTALSAIAAVEHVRGELTSFFRLKYQEENN